MKERLKLVLGMLIVLPLVAWSCGDEGKEDEPQPDTPGVEVPGEEQPDTPEAEPLTEKIRPVYTEGKKWVKVNIFSDYDVQFVEVVQGSTIIDGYEAMLVYKTTDGTVLPGKEGIPMREENGKVYRWMPVDGEEEVDGKFELYYDVNADCSRVFDTNKFSSIQGLQIESRGTIVLMGKTRRAVRLSTKNSLIPFEYWVEGVGPLFGGVLDENPAIPISAPKPKMKKLLECYDENGEKIYDAEEFSPDLYTEIEVFDPVE